MASFALVETVARDDEDVDVNAQPDVTKDRDKSIGGSDEPAVQNLPDAFMTATELCAQKLGLIAPTEMNQPMRWGQLLEPTIRTETAVVTGRDYRVPRERIVHPKYSFLTCHPDGISDDQVLLEVKTARTAQGWGEQGTDEIPPRVTVQVQHNLMVCGLAGADVAVLIGGSDHRVYEVPADTELQEALLEGCLKFWKFVESGELPPVDYKAPGALAFVRKLYPGTTGEIVKASTLLHQVRHDMESAKENEREAKVAADACMARLLDALGEGALLEFEDGIALRRQEVSVKGYTVAAKKRIDTRFINQKGKT